MSGHFGHWPTIDTADGDSCSHSRALLTMKTMPSLCFGTSRSWFEGRPSRSGCRPVHSKIGARSAPKLRKPVTIGFEAPSVTIMTSMLSVTSNDHPKPVNSGVGSDYSIRTSNQSRPTIITNRNFYQGNWSALRVKPLENQYHIALVFLRAQPGHRDPVASGPACRLKRHFGRAKCSNPISTEDRYHDHRNRVALVG